MRSVSQAVSEAPPLVKDFLSTDFTDNADFFVLKEGEAPAELYSYSSFLIIHYSFLIINYKNLSCGGPKEF